MGVLTSDYAGALTMLIMLAIGTTLRFGDLVAVLRRPRTFAVAFAGQQVLVPAVGLPLAIWLGGDMCLACALVAIVPGGLAATFYTALARGDTALSAVLTFASNAAVEVWLPFLLGLACHACGVHGHGPGLDYAALALRLAVVSALPILAGVALVALFPAAMTRLRPILVRLSTLLFAAIVAWILWDDRARLPGYLHEAGPFMTVLLLATVAVSVVVGRLFGLARPSRIAIGFEWSVHNVPLAILLATSASAAMEVSPVPSAAYGILQLVVGLAAALLLRRSGQGPAGPA